MTGFVAVTGFSRVPPGDYQIQAFLDVNHTYAYGGIQPGTLFSHVQTLTAWRPDASKPLALTLDQEVLRGKIHVIVGDADTYHLDESARTLEAAIRPLATGASFTYVPGKTHSDLYAKGSDPQALAKEIAAAMYAIARPGK